MLHNLDTGCLINKVSQMCFFILSIYVLSETKNLLNFHNNLPQTESFPFFKWEEKKKKGEWSVGNICILDKILKCV